MKIIIALILFLSITGCYPIYKTLQPRSVVKILDESGNPMQNSEVTLISNAYPYGHEKSREMQTTDDNGVAEFQSKNEWRTEVLMMHGEEFFFWNWCVKKDGYETYVTRYRSGNKFESRRTIRLNVGESVKCPDNMYFNALQ